MTVFYGILAPLWGVRGGSRYWYPNGHHGLTLVDPGMFGYNASKTVEYVGPTDERIAAKALNFWLDVYPNNNSYWGTDTVVITAVRALPLRCLHQP